MGNPRFRRALQMLNREIDIFPVDLLLQADRAQVKHVGLIFPTVDGCTRALDVDVLLDDGANLGDDQGHEVGQVRGIGDRQ